MKCTLSGRVFNQIRFCSLAADGYNWRRKEHANEYKKRHKKAISSQQFPSVKYTQQFKTMIITIQDDKHPRRPRRIYYAVPISPLPPIPDFDFSDDYSEIESGDEESDWESDFSDTVMSEQSEWVPTQVTEDLSGTAQQPIVID
jgi:hypothetical protein